MMNGRIRTAMAVVLLGLLMLAADATAQTGAEFRKKNRTRLADSGRWYDPGMPAYRIQYPALRENPAATVGIPRNIRGAYLYLDTLMRSPQVSRMFEKSDIREMKPRSISRLASYLYLVNDFNPVLFSQYADGIELHQEDTYRISLRRFSDAVYRHLREETGERGDAFYSLLYADYILHVKVHTVEPSFDEGQLETYFYRVTAEVVDTIKGRYFQPYERPALAEYVRPWGTSTIQFQYTPENYLQNGEIARERDEEKFPYRHMDPAFITGEGRFGMTPGQEAIIFLRHEDRLVDTDHDYYYLHLEPWASYNALPVVDGKVRDVNHIWSDSDLLSYGEWRSQFRSLRSRIVSAGG